ncbi:MAG: dihydroorotase [Bacteroidaceae bacterium]|nr:dihydroorotase [Bacteroidaceae bacterium]
MPPLTLISNGRIVNEGQVFVGDILISGDKIAGIYRSDAPLISESRNPGINPENIIDATGCYVLPGVIDTHVHFREPGLTQKADIESESRAAIYGGVTSYFDMPNCVPLTTTTKAIQQKQLIAAEKSHANYAFFLGATTTNADTFLQIDRKTTPGVKLFMGSSTGNMLVDGEDSLEKVFRTAAEQDLIVMGHCEDNSIILQNIATVREKYGSDAPVELHPSVRSREACIKSTATAIQLANRFGTRFHLAHASTKEEVEMIKALRLSGNTNITMEACLPHIVFNDSDYATRRTAIKCNPAVKTESDRTAILNALRDGTVTTIATDHAPHCWEDKQGGCLKAASGMPMLQFSLVRILQLFTNEDIPHNIADDSLSLIVRLMSHNPATLFHIKQRGFLKEGYKADITIVKYSQKPWTVNKDIIQSKCKWSPLEGDTLNWKVLHTFCNGLHALNNGSFNNTRGEQLEFQHE